MPETAIVILNWNGLDFLKMFLGHVIKLSSSPGVKVYVADNGSDDGSAEWVKTNHREAEVIRLDRNHGFAGGYNIALQQVKADYFVLLNTDIEVTSGWLTPLINHMEQNPGMASCMPKILSWKNRESFEYAGAAGGYIDKYGYPFCRGRIFGNVETDNGQYDNYTDIFWSSGACMIVRASAWERCSGFDSDFFAHMEEIDLCWRFAHAGYRVGFVPTSVVYHVGGGALPYESPFKIYLNFRNNLYMLYKNLNKEGFRKKMFIRKILDGLAALLFLLKGNIAGFRSVFKAHMDYYRNRGKLKAKRKIVQNYVNEYDPPVLNKSIVFEFYARGIKTFSQLNMKFEK
ncbi:MAG TPA: glycosyltransferase family 2 protein [Bacteroidales bacterium]|nr:glycosyltransferase family 2 protein [Bacteroidales bacterium]